MKISVIIPTYNRKHTIGRAIFSVLRQTHSVFELIVVDDGSDDGSGEWIRKEYPEIQYIFQPNAGVSSARNKGIELAKGSWIAFLDSDDEWLPKKIEYQIKSIQRNPDYYFCHTNEIWIRNGIRVNQKKKHKKYGGYIFDKCLDICRVSPSSTLVHKKIFRTIGLFDESLKVCEDYDLWLRIFAKYKALFLNQLLIKKYGGHLGQLSKVDGGIERYRIQSLEKILRSNMLKQSQFNNAKEMLIRKLNIYAKGLKKRNKMRELNKVNNNIQDWLNTPNCN